MSGIGTSRTKSIKRGNGQQQRTDPAWKYSVEIEETLDKPYKYFKCNFCSKEIKGGVKRVKDHLSHNRNNVAPCSKVPEEVKEEITKYMKDFEQAKHMVQQNMNEQMDSGSYYHGCSDGTKETMGSSRGVRGPMDRFMVNAGDDEVVGGSQKMTPATAKEHRNRVCLDIGRCIFENGIPFNVIWSPSWINMCRSIGEFGRGLKQPSMYEMRTWILDEEVKTTTTIVDEIKATWKRTGVSILSNGWSDMRNRSLINFLVNNPYGTVFLRSIDASDCVKDATKLFELLDGIVEEVGEDLVVQVVTDNASAYKAAGRMLMEKRKKLYWTPCAAHCIDLMLEKIGELPQHKNALLKAKRVANFIYNHQWVLNLARKYVKKDLLRPAATRFATAFLTLESMYELKQPLQAMFVSPAWTKCAWAKKDEGKDVKKIILQDLFWSGVVYAIKTTRPLVQVLRLVDGETPAMGFIYGAMDEAKEKIAKNLDGDVASYKEIWDIIDQKWEKQLHRDLHAAGYFLNPRFRWSPNVSDHPEIKQGLWNCMEKILSDDDLYMKVDAQIKDFKNKKGMFGSKSSLASYSTDPPLVWWDYIGDEVPELKLFAMKVLGLTCSSSACERNWSTFNQVHTKRRNRLTTTRLNKLVYVMYNKKLKHKFLKKRLRKDEDDSLIVEELPSDDEWIANPNDEEDMAIDVAEKTIEMMEGEEETSNKSNKKRKTNEASISSNKGKGKCFQSLVDEDEDVDEDWGDGDGDCDGDEDGNGEDDFFV